MIARVGDRFEVRVYGQGSGFIRLPDGSLYEIGYAGHTAGIHPIGKQLIADGKIDQFKLRWTR